MNRMISARNGVRKLFLAKMKILGIRRACKAPIFDFGFFCLFMDEKVPKFSVFAKNR